MPSVLIIVAGILAVSTASVLIKMCAAPAMVITAYRLSFASLFFVTASMLQRQRMLAAFTRKDIVWAGMAALFLCLHFGAWIRSLDYTSVATSVVLVSTTPVFVSIGGLLFLKEKPGKWLIAGIVLTLAGCVILSQGEFPGSASSSFGNFLALTGAVGMAGNFLIGRKLRAHIDVISYVAVVYSFAAIIMLLLVAAFDYSLTGYSKETYLFLFLIAFVPQVIGHTSFNWALEHYSAATVSVIALGEPMGAPIIAYFMLGEKITAIQLIGGILILTGVVVALKNERRTGR